MLTNDEFDTIADAVDPLLLLLTLVAPWWTFTPLQGRQRLWFYLAAGIGLSNVYLWQWLDHQFRLWPAVGLDYSTHTAFAVSLIVSLAVLRRSWLWGLVPLLLAYAILMRYLHYHTFMDVFTTTLAIAPLSYLIHGLNKNQ